MSSRAIDEQQAELEAIGSQMDELEEEHSSEDGAFAELDAINKSNVAARLKEIKDEPESENEAAVLKAWQKLYNQQSGIKKEIKKADAALDTLAYEKYPTLSEDHVKSLVVDDKWLTVVGNDTRGEVDRIGRAVTNRVSDLGDRYETSMPQLESRVNELEESVNGHLERMGFTWA